MAEPKLPWDASDEAILACEGLVWRARLDDRFLIEVVRDNPSAATLRIYDHAKDNAEIATWPVVLLFGAAFGPDISHTYEWMERCANFIDNEYRPQD